MDLFSKIFNKTQNEGNAIDSVDKKAPTTVVWIHGANASSNSFNFVRSHFPDINSILIDYNSSNGFYSNLNGMIEQVQSIEPVFVIGHSLGGIYALHLSKHIAISGGVSISTPFRGSVTADWARFMVPSYQLFKDVGRRSKPIIESESIFPNAPWTQIVTTSGNVPWHEGPNDGVVTLDSMEYLSDRMNLTYVNSTHYEIMCSSQTVDIISHMILL